MANWDQITETGNVEDRRGASAGAALAGGGGIVALILTLGLNYLGLNVPQSTVQDIVNGVSALNSTRVSQATQPAEFQGEDNYQVFTEKVLGSTNQVWTDIFAQNNLTYEQPKLVLFRTATASGCGTATTAMGPFYCPTDQSIYLDETFFDELKTKFGSDTGDLAQAYVIAHEVGHNVQDQLGAFGDSAQTNTQSIDIELQADCYAGVWAYAEARSNLFQGDEIDQAISAASAVGDDHIQRVEGMAVDPESWTHGSSAERVGAFKKGYSTGQPSQCKNLQTN